MLEDAGIRNGRSRDKTEHEALAVRLPRESWVARILTLNGKAGHSGQKPYMRSNMMK